MTKTIRGLLAAVFGDWESSTQDPEEAIEELRREREQAWAERSLPTFNNAYGCVSCGVIQIQPKNMKCALCRSSELVNLVMQLKRGASRIERRRKELRQITSVH